MIFNKKLYKKSAEQGHPVAQVKLGMTYIYGEAHPKDYMDQGLIKILSLRLWNMKKRLDKGVTLPNMPSDFIM